MIIVGKFAWSAALLLISHPPAPEKRRGKRIEVLVILARTSLHQQGCFIRPLIVEDVNARIDRDVGAGLLEIAAHLVVEVRIRAPAGRADRGDDLALFDLLSGVDLHDVALTPDGVATTGVIDHD